MKNILMNVSLMNPTFDFAWKADVVVMVAAMFFGWGVALLLTCVWWVRSEKSPRGVPAKPGDAFKETGIGFAGELRVGESGWTQTRNVYVDDTGNTYVFSCGPVFSGAMAEFHKLPEAGVQVWSTPDGLVIDGAHFDEYRRDLASWGLIPARVYVPDVLFTLIRRRGTQGR